MARVSECETTPVADCPLLSRAAPVHGFALVVVHAEVQDAVRLTATWVTALVVFVTVAVSCWSNAEDVALRVTLLTKLMVAVPITPPLELTSVPEMVIFRQDSKRW